MSQLVKTKRQANFKEFKRFGAFKGLVEQKNVVFNSFVCKLGLFWHAWAILKREKRGNFVGNQRFLKRYVGRKTKGDKSLSGFYLKKKTKLFSLLHNLT
jgi:hypothetical protein